MQDVDMPDVASSSARSKRSYEDDSDADDDGRLFGKTICCLCGNASPRRIAASSIKLSVISPWLADNITTGGDIGHYNCVYRRTKDLLPDRTDIHRGVRALVVARSNGIEVIDE